MSDQKLCEKCGSECERDEATVDFGVIYSPWECPNCDWHEDVTAIRVVRTVSKEITNNP